jgi:hypothetical protein
MPEQWEAVGQHNSWRGPLAAGWVAKELTLRQISIVVTAKKPNKPAELGWTLAELAEDRLFARVLKNDEVNPNAARET